MNNPHNTELSDFSERVIDVLYQIYVEHGGTVTKSQYSTMLFKVLHMASTEDVENGTDEPSREQNCGLSRGSEGGMN